MKFQFEKLRINNLFFVFPLALLLFSLGCEPPQATTNVSANANIGAANTVAATPASPAESAQSNIKMPVTLPVLDAMFAEEGFSGELKSKLQLTDEQVDKLKMTAHQAVTDLRENDNDAAGSTRAALARSDKQIREILGDDKATKLFEIVRQRWNGGEDANNSSGNAANNSASKVNAVPTDTRIVVNAPEYRMDLFQDGKLIKSYKVGIGYPEFPLPSGMRKATTIIFNPTWTPPDEPWVEGSKTVKAGQTVKAGDKLNPLGPIKIPIGLPSLIHGGKAPAKLGGFASHGCVGLTNSQVQDVAMNLARLSGTELMPEDVKNYEKQKTETKNVKLDNPIPVELRYETIVVEDGKLKIFRDVYERGTNTEENLRAVLENYGVSLDNLNAPEREKILAGLKQMAMDASGQAVDTGGNSNSNTNSNTNTNSNSNSNAKNSSDSKSGDDSKEVAITRSIKGKKEISFDIAELKGKGYPAPVDLSMK